MDKKAHSKKILNILMEIEVTIIRRYSTTPTCSEAKKGYETLYNKHKNKIREIQAIRDKELFSKDNLAPYLAHMVNTLKTKKIDVNS